MFLESFISVFLLGTLLGGVAGVAFGITIGAVIESNRASQHIAYYRGRSIRHLALAEQARKPHLGTPYLRRQGVEIPLDVPTPLPLDVALGLIDTHQEHYDTHSGSRRADVLEQRENVVPMQVQTGRPA